jgi:hypothetical protein
MIEDGVATAPPFLWSVPASSTFIGAAMSADDDEDDDEDAAIARLVRRSSFVAMASQMNGDSNEKLASNSLTLPSSLMFSSIATYSNPFCRNEINAPGGTSDWLTVLLATSDSYANVNALCEKPFSCRYL